ncbi:MAG: peptide chain release factor N(5)-glutamine methyltransferase, partial [Oscillospiraceae bacterium]|nr:peptide chain release factor N(5)-glutamine methyltransferase [Oscillospiraceae bacterium]
DIARQNAETLGLAESVAFYEGDLLAPLEGQRFDAIVSNPPYIPHGKLSELPKEVRVEPPLALDGGIDGLKYFRRLILESVPHLKEGGFLAMEVGEGQADAIATMARGGGLGDMERVRDLAGVDRVVIFRKV